MMLAVAPEGALDDGLDQGLLALEVIDDAGLADAGLGGHGIERQAGGTQSGHHCLCRIENGFLVDDALSSHGRYPFISDRMVINQRDAGVKTGWQRPAPGSKNKKAGPATRFFYSFRWEVPYLGASTMTIWRPSERGWLSTLAIASVCSRTLSSNCMPSSWCAISRPRKRMVTLTRSPSSRNRCTAFILVS